jgi:molybdopterin molybdotransferase
VITVDQALARLFDLAAALPAEEVPLAQAAGRVLARDVVAARAQPPFDAAAMDGYALLAEGLAPGAVLPVVGESAAGHRWAGRLAPGQAVRILTGAPLPEGATHIAIQENVTRDGDRIRLGPDALAGGSNIRPAGGDFAAGARIAAPRLLRPQDIALIAAMNHGRVTVTRRPEIAILATGDEIRPPGSDLGADQIAASNSYGIAALLTGLGARARLLPVAPDDMGLLDAAMGLAEGADVLVTIGGASVGDHDLVARAAAARGADLAFHKVAMRPGKPLMAGRMDGRLLIGLPGNPVSAMVCAVVFLAPVIRVLMGLPAAPAPRETRVLAAPLPPNGPREHYLRARTGADGVIPFDRQDSSLLSVLSAADCLIVQAAGDPGAPAGARVQVVAFS